MAKTYQLTTGRKLVNTVSRALLRIGLPLGSTYLLTVKGRKSGRVFTTPVTLVEDHERRWLVSPYGEVNWVRNARAAGQVTLTRGHHSETVPIVELSPADRAPVLREYLRHVRVVRPFFDITPSSPLEAFVAEAAHHPVFFLSDHPAGGQ
jgi:deazaflavin-dependent oxidoreductase (nitroreductase family)